MNDPSGQQRLAPSRPATALAPHIREVLGLARPRLARVATAFMLPWLVFTIIGRLSRRFGRLWARLASTVRAGCLTFETAPWEAMGLALARALAGLPVINALVRPVIPVAAQLLLSARPSAAHPSAALTAAAARPAAAAPPYGRP